MTETTKRARIVERPPTTSTGSYWYALEVVDGPLPAGTVLRSAFAKRQATRGGGPRAPDPVPRSTALGRLTSWAQRNGWTVVDQT